MAETYSRPRFGTSPEPAKRTNPGSALVRLLDFATATHARSVLFLVLCGFLFFTPGLSTIPPVDRDEARFAQATKQMVEASDYVDIRYQSEVRYKKPVGIYWLQAAAVETAAKLGVPNAQLRIWLYRLPSLLGAIGAVLLTYWSALAFVTRRGAVIAGLIICSSVMLGIEARLAKTDAMLLMTAVAAMGAMARVYLAWQRGEDRKHPWTLILTFWSAIAVGLLLKGPLILMFVGLPIVALAILDRSAVWLWRLRPAVGIVWTLLLVLPWFVAIYLKSGQSFFANSLGGDMLSKLASPQESHGAPPGFYFVLFWVTFWPGSSLAGLAAPAIWRARREPGAQFLLAWLVPSWIVFEIVITKLPHYTLPLYPAIAILIVGALERRVLSRTPWVVRGVAGWFAFPLVVTIGAVIASIALTRQPEFIAWPFAAGAMIFGLFAWWLYDDGNEEGSLLNAVASSWFVAMCVYALVLPALTPLFPSVQIARALRSVQCTGPIAASAGYHEPSLVFMAGTQTLLTNGTGAADFLSKGSCRFAIVEWREERAFAQRAETIGLRYDSATRIEGYNFSQGRSISVAIFRSEGTQ